MSWRRGIAVLLILGGVILLTGEGRSASDAHIPAPSRPHGADPPSGTP